MDIASDADPTDTRGRIRDVALELFARQGFDGTPLRQIADRVGLTKAALYHHFPSKDDLLAAIVGPTYDDLNTKLDELERRSDAASTRRIGLTVYLDHLLAHRKVLAFLTRDPALLTHSAIAARGQLVQARVDELLVGHDPNGRQRIRSAVAFGGMHGVVIGNPRVEPTALRKVVLRATRAVLDADSPGISGDRASCRG